MPKRLGGAAGQMHYNDGLGEDPPSRDAGISYGDFGSVNVFEEYLDSDNPSGKPELFSANNLLSASFGLMYGCAPGSYRGTAPRPSYAHGGPGVTAHPLSRSVWFSCTIAGAEGAENFTGSAVGWTRRHTAWLVIARDDPAARALVTALHAAG